MELLESIQKRTAKKVEGLKHPTYKERLRELGLLNLGRRKLRGILSVSINTRREAVKKAEPGSSQCCPMAGKEATDTH